MSEPKDDLVTNISPNPEMRAIIARRMVLKGSAGLAALGLFGGLAGCGESDRSIIGAVAAPAPTGGVPSRASALGFSPVAKSVADAVRLPSGYYATVLLRALGQ
jgi:hypothetical protein